MSVEMVAGSPLNDAAGEDGPESLEFHLSHPIDEPKLRLGCGLRLCHEPQHLVRQNHVRRNAIGACEPQSQFTQLVVQRVDIAYLAVASVEYDFGV